MYCYLLGFVILFAYGVYKASTEEEEIPLSDDEILLTIFIHSLLSWVGIFFEIKEILFPSDKDDYDEDDLSF